MSRELETTERIARGDHARSSYIQSRNSHVASNAAVPSEGGCIGSSHTADEVNTAILTSVVMPCLNEARTLAACIQRARVGCEAALAECGWSVAQATDVQPSYEIIVADNGSSDGSQSIAQEHGAQVVTITQKGYGAALQGGITAAKGRYVVMGDSDCSYDFGEVPRFIERLEQGYDLVMGNRFAGEIKPGAMPWHHRYIGNPVLSGLGRLLYRTPCRDWHCGLRAFDRVRINSLPLSSTGMEFASELVLRAALAKLRITEIPITLHPDGRERPPHLRSLRDGYRHLVTLLRRRGDVCERGFEATRREDR